MIRFRKMPIRSIGLLLLWLSCFLSNGSALQTQTPGAAESASPAPTREDPEKAEATVIRFGPRSAWTASTPSGRPLGGTWSGEIDLPAGTASGTWTLRNGAGRIVLHGTWSAAKSEREWRGSWRARMAGQAGERSGTWSAELQLPPGSPLAGLFERAVRQAVSGAWRTSGQSGGWSIRAVK